MSETLDLEEALAALERGEVVAVPTDTVYGLAASLDHEDAISTLFDLKRRPPSVPTPVLAHSLEQIESLDVAIDERTRALADAFWPGALTIVVAAPAPLAALVRSATDTVGFRIPDDALLTQLLQRSGPLAVTSANEHGEQPCTSAGDVLLRFAGRAGFAGVLDDGERRGAVSTVIDLSKSVWEVLREGAVPLEVLLAYLV
jgi:tRNA threonylcarbamoyl adenosine modification protein (Sua5/YciO/YrdC/YwlC family)